MVVRGVTSNCFGKVFRVTYFLWICKKRTAGGARHLSADLISIFQHPTVPACLLSDVRHVRLNSIAGALRLGSGEGEEEPIRVASSQTCSQSLPAPQS